MQMVSERLAGIAPCQQGSGDCVLADWSKYFRVVCLLTGTITSVVHALLLREALGNQPELVALHVVRSTPLGLAASVQYCTPQ